MATLYTRTIGSVTTNGKTITLKLVCTYTQAAYNDTSSVSIYVRVEDPSGTYNKITSWQITGNGPTGSGGESSYTSGTRNLTTKTKTLTHGLGGGGTFSSGAVVQISYAEKPGDSPSTKSFTLSNVSYALPSINVYTNLSFSTSSPDMSSSVTINITKPSTSAFTATSAKIVASYDGTETTVYEGANASTTWSVPDLSSTTPNSDTKAITIKVQSVRSGTYYTAKEYTLNVKVPAAYVPSCAIGTVSDEYGFSSFIANYSHLTIPVNSGVAGTGASIVSYTIEVRDTNASGALLYTATNTTTAATTSFTMPGTIISSTTYVKVTITDSRGRTGTATKTVSAVSYTQPQISLTAQRCNSGGTADPMGAYCKVVCTWSITQISTDNQVSGAIVVKKSTDGSTYSNIKSETIGANVYSGSFYVITALATSAQGWFYATMADNISSVTSSIKIAPKAILPLSLFDNGSDVGASIGQMSSEKGFHVYQPTEHRNQYVINSQYPSTSAGYVTFATITIKKTYMSGEIFLKIQKLGHIQPVDIAVGWSGGNTLDPSLRGIYATIQPKNIYIKKTATSTWALIAYVDTYQPISILDLSYGYAEQQGMIEIDYATSYSASLGGTLGVDVWQASMWTEFNAERRQYANPDLNTFGAAGFYYVYGGTSALHFPFSRTNGNLIVLKGTSLRAEQLFYDAISPNSIFTRTSSDNGSTWTDWARVQVVTSEGTSGNWYWRKYADGKAECWCSINTASCAITTQASGGFYRTGSAINSMSFPSGLFTEAPQVHCTCRNSSGTIIWTTPPSASITATSFPGNHNWHIGSGTYNVTNGYYAIGRWY